MPKRVLAALRGYVKRPGQAPESRELGIEVQWQAEHSQDGGFVFKEKAPQYLVRPGQYAGIIVSIKPADGTASTSPEENSVTLTVAQAEELANFLAAEVATIKKLARMDK
jgi:hypothetical protein